MLTRSYISFVVNLLLDIALRQHAAIGKASKTYSITLKVPRMSVYSIHMNLRMVYTSMSLGMMLVFVGFADVWLYVWPAQGTFPNWLCFCHWEYMISWGSMKQTLVDTYSNHAELISLHEATRECVWLRVVIEYIRSTSKLSPINDGPTTIHEDNAAWID